MFFCYSNNIVFTLMLFFIVSCSGYRFGNKDNPFLEYGISSVAVPMFVNKTIIPNINSSFTKEITNMLTKYPGLRVYPGEYKTADALLLGIIHSEEKMEDVFKVSAKTQVSQGELKESIGESRDNLDIPTTISYKVKLQIVLIKKPNTFDKKILESELVNYLTSGNKIIFNEILTFDSSFSRGLSDTLSVDKGGVVNYTKSQGAFVQSLENLALVAASRVRLEVLDAF